MLRSRRNLCESFMTTALDEDGGLELDPASILKGLRDSKIEIELIDEIIQELESNVSALKMNDIEKPTGNREDGPLPQIKNEPEVTTPFPDVTYEEKELPDEIS